MGLKISDAVRLSWSNIAQHKGRSAIVILTISILFGVVMAFNFILEGLRDTIVQTALQANNGKIYVETGYSGIAENNAVECAEFDSLEDAYETIRQDILAHGGQTIGEKVAYQVGRPRYVINQELAERFGKLDFSQVGTDQASYIAPQEESDRFYNQLKTDGVKDKNLVKVGTYPTTQVGSPTLPGFNPLNLLLSQVGGSASDADPLLVDDDSDNTMRYINNLIEQAAISHGNGSIESYLAIWPPQKDYVAVFDDYDKAMEFFEDTNHGKTLPKYIQTTDGKKYSLMTSETFGDAIGAELRIRNIRTNLILIEILFIVVAAIIATLTFAHIIDQDAATIALYRSLGASTGNIYLIYFLYLLEMCILAVIACIIIAAILVGILWLANASTLTQRLQEFYMLDTAPKLTFFGYDNLFLWIIGAIIMIAPITILLTLHNFSSKHIAKKLKEG